MPTARATHDFLRLLHEAAQPVYLVDDQRRIVFLNQACSQWTGIPADDLLGRQCCWQSGNSDPLAAAADALCPPPEAFHGRRVAGSVAKRQSDGPPIQYCADFLPLRGDDENWIGVLAIVDLARKPGEDQSANQNGALTLDEAQQLHHYIAQLRTELAGRHHVERLAGRSAAMQRVRAQVELAAAGRGTVLIVGPVGSGRQHVARTIHFAQQPPLGAFAPVDCSTLPVDVLRSTIASLITRHGRPESDTRVTLLLSDVHLLPAELQPELVRWLAVAPKNIRFIATAPEPLKAIADRQEFSADLAQSLGTLVIELPPLHQRRDDIPMLAQILLEDFNAQGKKQLRGLTPEALDRLAAYDWPGQVDELATMIREACVAADGFEITVSDLPKRLYLAADAARTPRKQSEAVDLEEFLAGVEKELIQRAMRETKGNKSKAARLLGLTRPKLYRRMVQLGLERGEAEDDNESE
jgi:DNA-binding NtrC family response regulator